MGSRSTTVWVWHSVLPQLYDLEQITFLLNFLPCKMGMIMAITKFLEWLNESMQYRIGFILSVQYYSVIFQFSEKSDVVLLINRLLGNQNDVYKLSVSKRKCIRSNMLSSFVLFFPHHTPIHSFFKLKL